MCIHLITERLIDGKWNPHHHGLQRVRAYNHTWFISRGNAEACFGFFRFHPFPLRLSSSRGPFLQRVPVPTPTVLFSAQQKELAWNYNFIKCRFLALWKRFNYRRLKAYLHLRADWIQKSINMQMGFYSWLDVAGWTSGFILGVAAEWEKHTELLRAQLRQKVWIRSHIGLINVAFLRWLNINREAFWS